MAIHITCPSCDASYAVDDDKQGKKVRCRKCGEPISVSAPKPKRRDEEAVQSGSKVKIKPAARGRQDDDEERRPTPRRKEPAKGGFPVMLVALGGVAVLLFLICGVGGIGGYFLFRSKPAAPAKDDAIAKAEGPKNKDAVQNDKGNPGEQPAQKQPFDDKLPGEIPAELVPKVKEATVYLKVTMANNSVATGSGFFALEPGVVITNAHVLGMLNAKNQPPRNVEVIVNAGQANERRLIGEVLGVDRINDLGVVRLKDANLPAPLLLESKHENIETQKVYIFGFPFGEDVAKTITVANSSISGFQHDQQTRELTQIRVNGGMHPGNSGGPVVNTRGQVIGVSVAGIKGTFINFAVPAEKVRAITEGGFTEAKYGEPFLDKGARHLPVHFSCLDPMNRIKEMRVEVWVGGAGPARLPSAVKPQSEPGDSARSSHPITYRDGLGKLDVPLPPLAPGQVYWLQPVLVTAKGTRWGPAQATMQTLAFLERKPADLTINFTAQKDRFSTLNSVYTVTESFGKMKFVDSQQVNAEFYEVLFPDEYRGKPAARIKTAFGAFSLEIFQDGKRLTHPDLNRGLGIVRTMPPTCVIQDTNEIGNFITVSLAPTNPLREMVSDLNHMVQNPLEAATIKMPNRIVQPMETFPAKSMMLYRTTQKSGGLKKKTEVKNYFLDLMLTCTYQGIRVRDGREEALITFVGNLEGRNELKGKIDGQLSGKIGFDVAGRFLSLVQLKVLSAVDFGDASVVREQDILVNRVAGNPKGLALLEEKKGPGPGPGPIATGKVILNQNTLLAPNAPLFNGKRHRFFLVNLEQGKSYQIDHMSSAFDAYLYLISPDGKIVAEDDDGGEGLNSRIIYRPAKSGAYRIIATSLGGNSTGAFQLVVQDLDAPKGGPIGPPPKQDLGKILGGAFDPQFKDEAPDGSLLVGLEVGLGKFVNNEVVKAIRPIYRDVKGKETLGKQYGKELTRVVTVKAKPGYAIGGLTVNAGLGVDGFTATFMKVNGAQLDAKDAYQSDHVGGKGGSQSILGGDGTAVIGILGKSNANDCTGIGLLLNVGAGPPVKVGGKADNPAPNQFANGDVTLRHLTFSYQQGGKIVGNIVWAKDAKSFFMLFENGMLQRVDLATGQTEQSLEINSPCTSLAMSGEGLLVAVAGREEVWVITPDNLAAVKKKIGVPGVKRVTAGVNAAIAYASQNDRTGEGVTVLDLKAGSIARIHPRMSAAHLTASPDGKYVFVQGRIEQLLRFRVEGSDLIEEEASHRIASNGQGIWISPDSKYVCLAAGGGNGRDHPDHPKLSGPYTTYIYPVTDLKRPATGYHGGAYPRCVGIDPKTGVILAHNFGKPLLLYTFKTDTQIYQHDCQLLKRADVREFSVAPAGGEAILRTDTSLIHIKINKGAK